MSDTASTTWSGWQIIDPRCYGCRHSVYRFGKLACYCVSRTMSRDMHDECLSYQPREVLCNE